MKNYLVGIFMVATLSVASAQPIVTESTNNNTNTNTSNNNNRSYSDSTSTVKSPPPTAVAPAVTSINNDVCAVVSSGAMQTQIFGISLGGTMRDMNCERIKLAKNLFDMGMKVAAVATLCQDERVFIAMNAAGTPCPVDGKIGAQAKEEWNLRDLESVDKNVGFYSAKLRPVVEPTESQIKDNTTGCSAYTGDDEVVIARVCGK